jgi:hypothetical protein
LLALRGRCVLLVVIIILLVVTHVVIEVLLVLLVVARDVNTELVALSRELEFLSGHEVEVEGHVVVAVLGRECS